MNLLKLTGDLASDELCLRFIFTINRDVYQGAKNVSLGAENIDFTTAAENTIHAVVHVKNKTVSKVATGEAKPNNQKMIDYGTEKIFLAPLSIKKIPMAGAAAGKYRARGWLIQPSPSMIMKVGIMPKKAGTNMVAITSVNKAFLKRNS